MRDAASPPRSSTVLLAALLALIAVGAVRARWTSPQSVDNRTYLEMIDGIAHRGLPITTNGPVGEHRALQARWNNHHGGHLWGALPPVFPYAAAPVYRLGGTRLVVAVNVLLLGALALLVARLTRRLTRSDTAGAAAAWVTLGGTPLATVAFDTSPYPVMLLGLTGCMDLALAALDEPGDARRSACGAGLCAGIAVGAHPLGSPMVAAILAALYVWPRGDDASPIAGWIPTREGLQRGAWATLGAIAVVVPVAALNAVRFGSLNPVSYGLCVWRSCAETGLDQGIGAMLRWAAPALAWAGLSLAAAWTTRRSRAATLAVAALSLAALAVPSLLRDRATAIAALAWAFTVDVSRFTLGYSFWRPADGPGAFLGPFAVRAALQCSPALLLAALASAAAPRAADRRAALFVGVACAALLASLALRANLPMAFALGYPFLSLRYLTPALPLLAALAVMATHALPWRRAHLALGAALAVGLCAYLWRFSDDLAMPRRVVLLRGTLAVAAAAFLALARVRGRSGAALATVAVAAAFATGFAVTAAVDLRESVRNRDDSQRFMDGLARSLPARFALVGFAPEIDPALGLRATRDVNYFDLYESLDWAAARAVMVRWWAEGRPVFVLQPAGRPYPSPRRDLRLSPSTPRGLYRVVPATAPR
ncbi:MAG: hypothetical protein U0325_33290 [Polyangiales bacterium]